MLAMNPYFQRFIIFLLITAIYMLWIFVGYDIVGLVSLPS